MIIVFFYINWFIATNKNLFLCMFLRNFNYCGSPLRPYTLMRLTKKSCITKNIILGGKVENLYYFLTTGLNICICLFINYTFLMSFPAKVKHNVIYNENNRLKGPPPFYGLQNVKGFSGSSWSSHGSSSELCS